MTPRGTALRSGPRTSPNVRGPPQPIRCPHTRSRQAGPHSGLTPTAPLDVYDTYIDPLFNHPHVWIHMPPYTWIFQLGRLVLNDIL